MRRLWRTAVVGALLASSVLALSSYAVAQTAREYPVAYTNVVGGLTAGEKRDVWFTGSPGRIAHITLVGKRAQYRLPTRFRRFSAIQMVTTTDGRIWSRVSRAGSKLTGIVRVTPRSRKKPRVKVIAASKTAAFSNLAAGPSGSIWFTDAVGIGRFSRSGAMTRFATPLDPSGIARIATARDGGLWCAQSDGTIALLSSDGTIRQTHVVPGVSPDDQGSYVYGGLITDRNGDVWFAGGESYGRLSTAGEVSKWSLERNSLRVVSGPQEEPWLIQQPNVVTGRFRLSRIDTSAGVGPGIDVAFGKLGPAGLGPDRRLWFVQLKRPTKRVISNVRFP